MPYEIKLTHVPDGAYTENYLGAAREQPTKRAAEKIVRGFYRAKKARPEDFEPDMEAEIIEV